MTNVIDDLITNFCIYTSFCNTSTYIVISYFTICDRFCNYWTFVVLLIYTFSRLEEIKSIDLLRNIFVRTPCDKNKNCRNDKYYYNK